MEIVFFVQFKETAGQLKDIMQYVAFNFTVAILDRYTKNFCFIFVL